MRNWNGVGLLVHVRLEAARGFEIRAEPATQVSQFSPSLECNYAFGFDVVARRWSRVMTAPRRLIGETSLRARTRAHTQGMDALSERGWLEAGWWRESKAGRQEVAERIDSVRMLRGCLTASRTRIPLIRHIVKCNYRGGLSGPRITDPPWRRPAAIADCSCASIVSIALFPKCEDQMCIGLPLFLSSFRKSRI